MLLLVPVFFFQASVVNSAYNLSKTRLLLLDMLLLMPVFFFQASVVNSAYNLSKTRLLLLDLDLLMPAKGGGAAGVQEL
jgi:hypothetical protein